MKSTLADLTFSNWNDTTLSCYGACVNSLERIRNYIFCPRVTMSIAHLKKDRSFLSKRQSGTGTGWWNRHLYDLANTPRSHRFVVARDWSAASVSPSNRTIAPAVLPIFSPFHPTLHPLTKTQLSLALSLSRYKATALCHACKFAEIICRYFLRQIRSNCPHRELPCADQLQFSTLFHKFHPSLLFSSREKLFEPRANVSDWRLIHQGYGPGVY